MLILDLWVKKRNSLRKSSDRKKLDQYWVFVTAIVQVINLKLLEKKII